MFFIMQNGYNPGSTPGVGVTTFRNNREVYKFTTSSLKTLVSSSRYENRSIQTQREMGKMERSC